MAVKPAIPAPSADSVERPAAARTVEVLAGPATDPLAWLAVASEVDEAWFWEVPGDDDSWVGLGSALVSRVDEDETRLTHTPLRRRGP